MLKGLYRGLEFFTIQIRVSRVDRIRCGRAPQGVIAPTRQPERMPWPGLARPPTSFSAGLSWHQGVDTRAKPRPSPGKG